MRNLFFLLLMWSLVPRLLLSSAWKLNRPLPLKFSTQVSHFHPHPRPPPNDITNNITNNKHYKIKRLVAAISLALPIKITHASASFPLRKASPLSPLTRQTQLTMASVFLSLFGILALLHAAEIAITTLYPWKVREFAKEEGDDSPFHTLNNDITKVLTTILITSTTTSIYATTLFASLVSRTYGAKGERYGSIILTALTLFFVELVPKSIGINNAEFVARRMVAPINLMGKVVGPFGLALTYMAKSLLKLFGMQTKDLELVSEEEVRLS